MNFFAQTIYFSLMTLLTPFKLFLFQSVYFQVIASLSRVQNLGL